ncbi:MAG: hypothetical protein Q4F05_12615 [bacterium]|nr:hypothetical protein [bacterium]
MSKTKIVVLHLKEIIYTAIFVGLGILLILLLVFMFLPKNTDSTSDNDAPIYKPGVYTSQMTLNNATLNLEVVVDKNHVNSVKFVNLDKDVTTMYPLVEPALEDIASQLYLDVPVDEILISDSSKYTSVKILDTIKDTLEKAQEVS